MSYVFGRPKVPTTLRTWPTTVAECDAVTERLTARHTAAEAEWQAAKYAAYSAQVEREYAATHPYHRGFDVPKEPRSHHAVIVDTTDDIVERERELTVLRSDIMRVAALRMRCVVEAYG